MKMIKYFVPLALLACEGASTEARRVEVPVVVAPLAATLTTDQGYTITLTEAALRLDYLTFTRGGEEHTVAGLGWLVGTAHAHPGHLAGGEVLGELRGPFTLDLLTAGPIGQATLVAGPFDGAGFLFGRGTEGALADATLAFAGTATRDGRTLRFTAAVDQDPNRQVVGMPFDVEVTAGATLHFGLVGAGLFDGLDFFALAPDADTLALSRAPGGPPEREVALNRLRRTTQSHEHYTVTLTPEMSR